MNIKENYKDRNSLSYSVRPESYSERFDNDKSKIGNPETWGKRFKTLTAVEFLNEQIILNSKNHENSKGGISFKIGLSKFDEIFQQARAMEKQQIIDAYRDGRSDQQSERPTNFYNRSSEQYYNETYKSDKL